MNNQRKIVLVGGIVLVMVVLIWFFTGGSDLNQKQTRKPFVSSNWTKRFQLYDKNPMGQYLFNSLVAAHLDTTCDITILYADYQLDSINVADSLPKTYMFVGNKLTLLEHEMDLIMSEVNKGSDLFMAYNGVSENITDRLFRNYEERFDYGESINVFAKGKKHYMINLYQNDTIATDWSAFGEFDPRGKYQSLSSFMEMSNFIQIGMGKGSVFINTTPGLFYNYQIKRKDGFRYADFVINQVPKDQNVYLLEFGRATDNYGNEDVDQQDGADGKEDTSYLRVIFENETLLKALLFGLLGIVLFIIFRSKRVRPIVPYVEKKKDMTLAFAETITSIYFSKRNPYGMLHIQRKNFYNTIQKHFFIDLTRRDGDRELQMLAEKSNKPLIEIKELIAILETKEASTVDDNTVAEVDKMKRRFYQDTGIITDKIKKRLEREQIDLHRSLLWATLFILGGIGSILTGFYLLIQSIGAGIALWPIGIATLILGILRLRNPILRITPDTMTHYTAFGRKRIFDRDDMIRVVPKARGVVIHFTDNRTLIINYADMSSFDRKQFKKLISALEMNEL